MSSFDYVQNAVAELIDELAVAEVLCDEQAERVAAVEAETAGLRAALESGRRTLLLGPAHSANGGRSVSEQRVARLEAENRHLREALVLALRFIDPEQYDVIEEIEMTLYGDLDDALRPGPAG